jgi:hypothetical protein
VIGCVVVVVAVWVDVIGCVVVVAVVVEAVVVWV